MLYLAAESCPTLCSPWREFPLEEIMVFCISIYIRIFIAGKEFVFYIETRLRERSGVERWVQRKKEPYQMCNFKNHLCIYISVWQWVLKETRICHPKLCFFYTRKCSLYSPPSYQRRGIDFLLLETTLDSYQPRDGARGISKQILISPIYLSSQSAALRTLKPFPLSCHFSTNV